MRVSKILASIMLISIASTALVGCNKQETSSYVEVIPTLYTKVEEVSAEDATKTANNLAAYVGQCVIKDDKNGFANVLNIQDSLLTVDDLWETFTSTIGEVDSNSSVYKIDSDEGLIIVTVGVKEGDYYKKDAEGNDTDVKLGETITNAVDIKFPFEQVDGLWYYATSNLLDMKAVKIKIPEGAKLKIDGIEIGEDKRNKDGYFVVKGFKKTNVLKAVVDTEIRQGMEFDLSLVEISKYDNEGNPVYKPIKDRTFTPTCYLDLETKNQVEEMANEALQAIITSLENNEEIYNASCKDYFASSANLDEINLLWTSALRTIHKTRDYAYSDIKLLSLEQYTDDKLKENRVSQNVIKKNNEAILMLKMKTSFNRMSKYDDKIYFENKVLDSKDTSFVEVHFAIEDGKYKIVSLSDEFFNGLVKRG